MAERWFAENDWSMVRTQPAIRILGSKPGSRYGRIFTVCMVGKGGSPDYTGYMYGLHGVAEYRACEVKEVSSGNSMPASRLSREQRDFMGHLPEGCAWVGVWWVDYQRFEMYKFKARGAYRFTD